MAKIVTLLVGINAALGIAAWFGAKLVVNSASKRARLIFERDEVKPRDQPRQPSEAPPQLTKPNYIQEVFEPKKEAEAALENLSVAEAQAKLHKEPPGSWIENPAGGGFILQGFNGPIFVPNMEVLGAHLRLLDVEGREIR